MSEFERKKIDKEFEKFTKMNFEKPRRCRDLTQIRFYVKELSIKMDELKRMFNYVPRNAYTLLAQYNAIQNRIIFINFKNSY